MFRFFTVFFLTFLFTSSVFAETKTGQDVPVAVEKISESDVVSVYASRLESLLQPQSRASSNVTVISENELKSKKPMSFQEALSGEEGVVFYDTVGNGWDRAFSMRGFNESNAVTVLVDGVRVNEVDGYTANYPLLSMDDIERIQIERGPSSPVYGSNALAGVVNITTGRPSKKPWSLFGGVDVSSHQGIHFYQGVSGTMQDKVSPIEGAFEYYFRGGRNLGEGFRGNSDFRISNFDFKTAYVLPEEAGRLFVNVKHVDDMVSNPGELTFNQYQASPKRTNKPNDRRSFINTIAQIGADKKIWDNKITASLLANWRFNDSDFINTTTQFGTNTRLAGAKSRQRELIGQLSYEDAWEWLRNTSLIGFEIHKGSEVATLISAPGGEVAKGAATTLDRQGEVFNSALFWNEKLGLTDYVDLNVGMRHDRYTLHTINPKSRTSNYADRWNSNTVSTGITVHPIKPMDVFFQYSEGFRAPDLSDVNPFAGSTPPDILRPEQSKQYEVGTRYRFRDLFQLRGSWFLIDMEDEIVNDTTAVSVANPFGQNVNIGKSRRYGFEQGVEVAPLPEARFFGTYTWTKAYVRETNVDAFGGQIFDGRDLGQVPRQRMTWGAEVKPLARLGEYFEGLRFRLDGSFTGKQHPQSYESTSQAMLNSAGGAGHKIKSYTLWNFLAGYAFKNQEIYFKINNLFDNKYYSRAVVSEVFTAGTYPVGVDTFVNPGAPREYLVGMRWEIE